MLKTIPIIFLILFSYISYGQPTHLSNDERYIAGVIYAESKGQAFEVKQYVATVIYERSQGIVTNFIKTCKLPRQFVYPEYADDVSDVSWKEALAISRSMYHKTFIPLTITIDKKVVYPDHFYCGKVIPFWARGKKHIQISDLKFLHLGKYRSQ